MNIVSAVKEYTMHILDKVRGIKVLLLDHETVGIISMACSHSEILEREVFLVQRIDANNREKISHLNCVALLRPTNDNFIRLANELKHPKYKEYHLFFTGVVSHSQLERLSKCDDHDVVHTIMEYFGDFYPINVDLFSLNIPSCSSLTQPRPYWTPYDESAFDRMVDGVFAATLSMRVLPYLRYQKNSDTCQRLAEKILQKFNEERSLFDSFPKPNTRGGCVLLILDRREDPVTPLLTQWTYQAMVHELLSIDTNRVDMRKCPNVTEEHHEIVLSSNLDEFFNSHLISNFGDLGASIKSYVEAFQDNASCQSKINSMEDMQRFVDTYPDFNRLFGNVSKHVALVHEMSRLVDLHQLLDVSQLEQSLACEDSQRDHLKSVIEKLRASNIRNMDKLKLSMLYALRYEHDQSGISTLKKELTKCNICIEQVNLIDAMLQYAGGAVRSGDLFQRGGIKSLKNAVERTFKGVANVYTQHRPLLQYTLDALFSGKLKETTFPLLQNSSAAGPLKEKPNQAIVFMVGGATYEEAKYATEYNRQACVNNVVVGGSTIHNSRSFLADISQLIHSSKPSIIPVDPLIITAPKANFVL
eukprot:GHVL01030640.1.p1 GENE.GHVL01030640.1~~GHVL01030640.1.p1  ORF type:complete len:587 (+),score=104.11 GHVL01030640.1:50-1810(+)